MFGYAWTGSTLNNGPVGKDEEEEEDEPDPPRNFTSKQLLHFNGEKDPKSGEDKPIYLSLNGTVFDVSSGRNFYGPDGPYEAFAGHECGVALAKMSFDKEHLDDIEGCNQLNFGEKNELEGWIEKFTYYRPYPIKGRLIPSKKLPKATDNILTLADLSKHRGTEEEDVPEGYGAAPIYVAVLGKVYDVSFGGVTNYRPLGPYHGFAGKDASRALAKMSLDPAVVDNREISDLTESEQNVLNDWAKTFEEKKGYPVVGRMKS